MEWRLPNALLHGFHNPRLRTRILSGFPPTLCPPDVSAPPHPDGTPGGPSENVPSSPTPESVEEGGGTQPFKVGAMALKYGITNNEALPCSPLFH